MNIVHKFTDEQEDLALVFYTLAEMELNGDLAAPLAELYQKVVETPLGQKLVQHLPSAKAAFACTKPFLSEALRLMVIAQNLSEHVVRDYQRSPASEIGRRSDCVIPEAVEYV